MEIITALWLDEKIEKLNKWIDGHDKLHHQYRQKLHNRNYYVGKRIEI